MNNAKRFSLQFQLRPATRLWLVVFATCAALLFSTGSAHAVDRTPFDHLTTGFELLGQHRDLPCESCHVNAIFKGTPKDCAACHGVGTTVRATAKPVSHMLSTNRCESCHTPVAWNPAVNFDHAEVRGACSNCHNNVQAQGKGVGHIDTSLECNLCHTTIGWAGAVYNHSNVTTGCARCHNGASAKGPPATHIPTGLAPNPADLGNAPCEACHTPTNYVTFAGTAMNHPAVVPPLLCADCHEKGNSYFGVKIVTRPDTVKGVTHPAQGDCGLCHQSTVSFATGNLMPTGHILTSQVCTLCHANLNDFTQKAMDHTGISSGCATCHAAGLSFFHMAPLVLVTPPANHIDFGGAACESCHSNSNFASPNGFRIPNTSGAAPPAMVHAAVAGTACATCHGAGKTDYGTAPKTTVTFTNPAIHHVPVGSAACDSCHSKTDFSSFVIPNASTTAAPGMVHTAVAGTACSTCHEKALSWVGTVPQTVKLRPLTEPHQNNNPHPISGECSDCHKSTTTFQGATSFPTNHIPLLSATVDCLICHTTAGTYTAAVMGVLGHNLVTIVCSTCHAAGKSFANMSPTTNPALVQPPAKHVPFGSVACDKCHLSTNVTTGGFQFSNASGTSPAAMVHATVAGVACATCHASTTSFIGAPATKTNATTPTHVPIGTAACEGCHLSTSTATNGFRFANKSTTAPAGMVHAKVTAACSTCHEAGKSWIGTPATVVRPLLHNPLDPNSGAHVTTGECSGCHFKTTDFLGATDVPANHIPLLSATSACGTCHTDASTYSKATMLAAGHKLVSSVCATCHAAGKSFANMSTTTTPALVQPPSNHVPFGTAPCSACHSPSNFAIGGFKFTNASGTAPPAMVHTAVPGVACATCHGPTKSFIGTPAIKTSTTTPLHVPIGTAACEGCHLSTSTATNGFKFTNASGTAPAAMVHSKVAGTVCSTCHEKGKAWIGTPATRVRPALKADNSAHVATGECSTCHLNTTSFKGATDLPANHIPLLSTTSTCATCHTTGVYSAYVMGTTGHALVSKTCMTCHAVGLTFANLPLGTLKQPPTGAAGHIPTNTGTGSPTLTSNNFACELCHLPTVFTSFAGTVMKHAVVRGMTCMSCHEIGMTWKVNKKLWVRDGAGHHKGVDCGGSGCHSTKDKYGARRAAAAPTAKGTAGVSSAPALSAAASLGGAIGFNHRRVAGTACISCHGPASGIGKSPNHIATSDSCESCHMTAAWLPVTHVDHLQVKGSCVSCHNGTAAPGKGGNHIASSDTCETCHTTNAWTPARFDHVGVAAHTCKSCHDSIHAAGLPAVHVPTSAQCDTCHGTLGWKPAKLDHSRLSTACASCHDNNIALGVTPTHMSMKRDCATCHSYPDWAVLHFVHVSASFPGEHRAALACTACHSSNTDQIPWASPAEAGSCAGCHAKDFRPNLHPKSLDGLKYTADELRNCTGACHVYSDATLGTVAKPLPGPYHRVTDAAFKH